jgi:large subunit ribosomal protein L49
MPAAALLTPSNTPKPVVPTESYFVRRTSPGNLPVYHTKKRGGNLRETKIRKIEGNIMVLRDQLQKALGVESKEVNINPLTHDIIIKVSMDCLDELRSTLMSIDNIGLEKTTGHQIP